MWRLAAAAILLTGCLSDRREAQRRHEMEQLWERARIDLQAGKPEAGKAIESGSGIARALGDPVAQWRFRLLRCELLLADRSAPSTAAALPDLRTPLPQRPEFAPLAARQKMLEGQAMVVLGRYKEAGEILDTAYRLAGVSHDTEALIGVETLQGSRFIHEGNWDAAEQWLHRALDRAHANHLTSYEPQILVNFGIRRLSRHRYDEALGYFQSVSQLTRSKGGKLYSLAQANLAVCYYRLGEFDRAIQILLESIRQQQRSGANYYSQITLGDTGNAYLLKGDPRSAAKYLEDAFNAAKEIGNKADTAVWAGNLAILYADLGDWNRAERFNNEAIRIKKEAGSPTLVYNTLNTARIAVGRGHYAEGDALYQQAMATSPDNPGILWEAYGALGESAMLQHHPEPANRYFESAVKIVEETRSGLSSPEFKLPFLTRLIRFYQQYVDALIAQGDYERALSVADSSRAQVLAERFGATRVGRRSPEGLKKVAQASGSTIVSYWLGPQRSHAWVLTGAQSHHVDLPPEPEIAASVAEYSDAVQRRLADPMRVHIPAGERLFQILVEPLQKWLPAKARIVVVPDGVLAGLNFETLPVPGDKPHYWIEDATITVAPSIGVLSDSAMKPGAGRGLLLIGDPDDSDPAFPPLSHASAEIDDVLRHFDPATTLVLRKKDAVPQSYQTVEPGRFAVIHFTAHAVANRESPLDSAVLLSGGKLYAREVMDRRLNAELVTFSACRGAGLRMYGGEGLVGFAWAFLRAGARNVVAGLWDVNDQSTADLMDLMYREVEAGRSPQDALRMAKLGLIGSAGNLKKPYYWGPFQVYTLAP